MPVAERMLSWIPDLSIRHISISKFLGKIERSYIISFHSIMNTLETINKVYLKLSSDEKGAPNLSCKWGMYGPRDKRSEICLAAWVLRKLRILHYSQNIRLAIEENEVKNVLFASDVYFCSCLRHVTFLSYIWPSTWARNRFTTRA